MAKKKKPNTKVGGGRKTVVENSDSEEEGSVFNDGASVASEASTVVQGDTEEGVDETSELEQFEGKLKDAIELATQKSAAGRVKALDAICTGFLKRYCPDFVEKVKFGQEVLFLDCWYKKVQYDWFCKVIGSGMNLHLNSNYMLREVFELGAPLPAFDAATSSRPSKTERNAANQLAFKARTQSRNKNRDKRSAVF